MTKAEILDENQVSYGIDLPMLKYYYMQNWLKYQDYEKKVFVLAR